MKFKFARTRIWMYYVSEMSPLPPPFNLVPVDKAVSGVRWLAGRYGWINKVSMNNYRAAVKRKRATPVPISL